LGLQQNKKKKKKMERGIRAAVALGLVWWRPATGRVAGGGARWRAGHRGAPVRRRQGRQRPATYRERERECGRERRKRERREGERERGSF